MIKNVLVLVTMYIFEIDRQLNTTSTRVKTWTKEKSQFWHSVFSVIHLQHMVIL